jgi:hypothetical protein
MLSPHLRKFSEFCENVKHSSTDLPDAGSPDSEPVKVEGLRRRPLFYAKTSEYSQVIRARTHFYS